jgi:hypothetical protein
MPSTCKGDGNKQLLAKNYHLTCIAHFWTFERKENLCWCGKPLEHEAYLFVRWNRSAVADGFFNARPEQAISFPVGTGCATKLADAANIMLPPKCTIFLQAARKPRKPLLDWCGVNLELYRAIQCLCSLADYFPTPKSKLGRYLTYLTRNPGRSTDEFAVIEFNRLIPKILIGSTCLRASYAAIMSDDDLERPEMSFPEMENILVGAGQKSCL